MPGVPSYTRGPAFVNASNFTEAPTQATYGFEDTSAPVTPITILGANCLQWCRSDMGVQDDGSGRCNSWTDQVNGANSYAQSGASTICPTITTGLLNGRTALVFDGSDDYMESLLNLGLPGTQPYSCLMVLEALSFANGDTITDATSASNKLRIHQDTVTPNVRIVAGSGGPANTNLPTPSAGVGRMLLAYWSNSTSDYLRIGSSTVTGVNTGNLTGVAGTGRRLGRAGGASALYMHMRLYEVIWANGDITGATLTAFENYFSGLYLAPVLA